MPISESAGRYSSGYPVKGREHEDISSPLISLFALLTEQVGR
ncbi:hypothetical protein COLO4_03060 [Corchorus olitorius]|uniref:Uncharacterized protein n=1 Tax=Corchorus olitorius TaxID=93759 RepID=A0A1R3KZK3_9ROSI|nr:hypothetical protein COLO4_03060 [Corchorus olitorius]